MSNDSFVYILMNVHTAREDIVQELRAMAAAEGKYTHYVSVSPWEKNVWRLAAALLERDARAGNNLH